jgi:hypothetical protein
VGKPADEANEILLLDALANLPNRVAVERAPVRQAGIKRCHAIVAIAHSLAPIILTDADDVLGAWGFVLRTGIEENLVPEVSHHDGELPAFFSKCAS